MREIERNLLKNTSVRTKTEESLFRKPPEALMKPNIFQKQAKSVLETQEFLQNHSKSNRFQAVCLRSTLLASREKEEKTPKSNSLHNPKFHRRFIKIAQKQTNRTNSSSSSSTPLKQSIKKQTLFSKQT